MQLHSIQLERPRRVEKTEFRFALFQPARTQTVTLQLNIKESNCFFFQWPINWITCVVGGDPPHWTRSLPLAQEWNDTWRCIQVAGTDCDPPSPLQVIEGTGLATQAVIIPFLIIFLLREDALTYTAERKKLTPQLHSKGTAACNHILQ